MKKEISGIEIYQDLSKLTTGRIGNAYTKRMVWVERSEETPTLDIALRVYQNRAARPEHYYTLTLTPTGEVEVAMAKRWEKIGEEGVNLNPPKTPELLREIRRALKIQPKLKGKTLL